MFGVDGTNHIDVVRRTYQSRPHRDPATGPTLRGTYRDAPRGPEEVAESDRVAAERRVAGRRGLPGCRGRGPRASRRVAPAPHGAHSQTGPPRPRRAASGCAVRPGDRET